MNQERYAPAVKAVDGFLYGGDYNPEQWPEAVWEEDLALMKAAGVNLVTVGVFSWALLEPREGEFDFSRLDRILDLLGREGIKVDLATATAAQPVWASLAYPDIAPVDDRGRRYSHGSRQTYCPNSPSYRRLSARLVKKMAERYSRHPALALWHVNNEVACHIQACHCPTCAAAFRDWLSSRYATLDRLNEAWGTAFWSQRYSDWKEILPPLVSTTNLNPAARLDYRRFMSDSFLALIRAEVAILRRTSPGTPVTTNLMWTDGADWFGLRAAVDCLAYDSYPDPLDPESWRWASFMFDLTRGHLGGRPWLLMEQAPSQVNWRAVNAAKEPGTMRRWSFQALAHGSDSVLFFQWRASLRGSEQFHSAMLPHAGPGSRRHAEVKAFGAELGRLSRRDGLAPRLAGSVLQPRVAILYSYEAWWFSQYRPFPTEAFDYQRLVRDWHELLSRLHVDVDLVSPSDDLSGYGLVLAPALCLADDGLLARLRAFVEAGGSLVTGPGSAIVDPEGQVRAGGYGGDLASLCGLRIEEYDVEGLSSAPPAAGEGEAASPTVAAGADAGTEARARPMSLEAVGAGLPTASAARAWFDLLEAAPGTEILARYAGDRWFAGFAAATTRLVGTGRASWIGTRAEAAWLDAFFAARLAEAGIVAPVEAGPEVESSLRRAEGEDFLFLTNHGRAEATVLLREEGWLGLVTEGVSHEGKRLVLQGGATALLSRRN